MPIKVSGSYFIYYVSGSQCPFIAELSWFKKGCYPQPGERSSALRWLNLHLLSGSSCNKRRHESNSCWRTEQWTAVNSALGTENEWFWLQVTSYSKWSVSHFYQLSLQREYKIMISMKVGILKRKRYKGHNPDVRWPSSSQTETCKIHSNSRSTVYLKRCDSFAVTEASDSPLKNEGKLAVIYRPYTNKILLKFVHRHVPLELAQMQHKSQNKWISLSQWASLPDVCSK